MANSGTTRKRKSASSSRRTSGSRSSASARRRQQKKYEEERRERKRLYRSEAAVIAVFAVAVLMLLGNFGLCGSAGKFLQSLQLGLFGIPGYVFPVLLLFAAAYGIANAGNGKALAKIPAGVLLYLAVCGFVQLFAGGSAEETGSISELYRAQSGGGLLGGIFSGLLRHVFGTVGTFLILAAVIIFMLVVITERSFVRAVRRRGGMVGRQVKENLEQRREEHRARAAERDAEQKEHSSGIDFQATDLKRDGPKPAGAENAAEIRTILSEEPAKEESVREEPSGTKERNFWEREDWKPDGSAAAEAGTASAGDFREEDASVSTGSAAEAGGRVTSESAGRAAEAPESGEYAGAAAAAVSGMEAGAAAAAMSGGRKDSSEKNLEAAFSAARNPVSSAAQEDPALAEAFRRADEILKHSGKVSAEPAHPITADDNTVRMQEEPEESGSFGTAFDISSDTGSETASETGTESGFGPSSEPFDWKSWNPDEEQSILSREQSVPSGEQSTREEELSHTSEEPSFAAAQESGAQKEEFWHSGGSSFGTSGRTFGVSGNAGASGAEYTHGMPSQAASTAYPASAAEARAADGQVTDGQVTASAAESQGTAAEPKEYVFPDMDLLEAGKEQATESEDEYRRTAMKLQETLKSFGVDVTVTNYSRGPAVTRYELLPAQGVKVGRIIALSDDIKLSLAAADIRIEAPIPGKSAVGIEVPNKENQIVHLRDLLESDAFRNSKAKIAFALGKDIGGRTVVTDISKMPHVLIAGATGSGKSVCINTLIMSILYRYRPDEVKLMMIDPKVVELSVYNGIPHLMLPVITDAKKAAGALAMAVAEMEDRYKKFASAGVRDLKGYNERIREAKESGTVNPDELPETLPQIVIIIDELADLMMVSKNEVEGSIVRIAQLARAAGMHLVIATQRPSVNVITGLIKANIPTRIAFAVSSGVDSRTILDGVGAEKLLGKGDMLFSPQGASRPQRIQGAFVSDQEVQKVVDFIRQEELPLSYTKDTVQKIAMNAENGAAPKSSGRDELFVQAGRFIIEKKKASIGNLQRMFKIGFNRAARIMDQLCEAGVVGEEQGTKPREILMTAEQFEELVRQSE